MKRRQSTAPPSEHRLDRQLASAEAAAVLGGSAHEPRTARMGGFVHQQMRRQRRHRTLDGVADLIVTMCKLSGAVGISACETVLATSPLKGELSGKDKRPECIVDRFLADVIGLQ